MLVRPVHGNDADTDHALFGLDGKERTRPKPQVCQWGRDDSMALIKEFWICRERPVFDDLSLKHSSQYRFNETVALRRNFGDGAPDEFGLFKAEDSFSDSIDATQTQLHVEDHKTDGEVAINGAEKVERRKRATMP